MDDTAADAQANDAKRSIWSRHWATGAAHSCVGSFGDTYEGALAAVWKQALAAVPPGTRVLDIATGSGAVPRLLLRLQPKGDFSIDAIDLADGVPSWVRLLPAGQVSRLRFHPGIAAESLPFPDGCFGLVTSQYGLEYADLHRAVPEMLRVLAPGGQIALTLHHAQSRPVALAAIEIAHIDWLYGPDALLQAARAMLEPMARAVTEAGRASLMRDPAATAIRTTFNAAQTALSARGSAAPDGADVLAEAQDSVAQLLQLAQQQGHAGADAAWLQLDQHLKDARWRLQDLIDCALSADAAHGLCERLKAHGLKPSLGTVTEQGHLMGWQLNAN